MARGDLKNPKAIYVKGFVFAALAIFSALILLIEHPTLRFACLLAICVWSSCRFYYFAFYVIQHYVDPEYKFAGLIDFVRYLAGRPRT